MVDVLVADDKKPYCTSIADYLRHFCYLSVDVANSANKANNLLDRKEYKLVLLNYRLGTPSGSDEVLKHIKETNVKVDVFMMSYDFSPNLNSIPDIEFLRNKQKDFPFIITKMPKGDYNEIRSLEKFADEINRHVKGLGNLHDSIKFSPTNVEGKMEEIDVGLITIIQPEYEAVVKRFHPIKANEIVKPGITYPISIIETDNNKTIKVAHVNCFFQGENISQDKTRTLVQHLKPKFIFLVGIAGGGPSFDFTLGDAILATHFHDYCVGAIKKDGSYRFNQLSGKAHNSVFNLYSNILTYSERIRGWNDPEKIDCIRPNVNLSKSNFYGDTSFVIETKKMMKHHFRNRNGNRINPILRTSGVITSNTLVQNDVWYTTWQNSARDATAMEMEIAGVYLGAKIDDDNLLPVVAIRGISDIVGFLREPDWTEYACNTAASLAYHIIKSGLIFET